jgi:hypothetical protein
MMVEKKRCPLSIFENMGGSISPDMKPCDPERLGYVFKSGLIGPFSSSLMFSYLDIFIEKPFSVLSFHVCQLCKTTAKTTAAPLKSKVTHSEQYAHASN